MKQTTKQINAATKQLNAEIKQAAKNEDFQKAETFRRVREIHTTKEYWKNGEWIGPSKRSPNKQERSDARFISELRKAKSH